MRILVTGSRNWDNMNAVNAAIIDYVQANWPEGHPISDFVTLVHGDCPTGADAYTQSLADVCSWNVDRHPADWNAHGRAAGPIRNQEMVDLGADVCIAFPMSDSRGTIDCMTRAESAGIPVVVVEYTEPEF